MKPTDFAKYLTEFLTDYMIRQRNASENTIHAYRDTFKLLLEFGSDELNVPAEKLTLDKLTHDVVVRFLNWLEDARGNSVATRNLRLAALRSFFRYVQYAAPERLDNCQRILAIPVKSSRTPIVEHLSPDGIRILLEQPDRNSPAGRRDLALLTLLYDAGARVREIIDLDVRDFADSENPTIVLTGKGSKTRRVPLMHNTGEILRSYIREQKLDVPAMQTAPMFFNRQRGRLTKEGVAYVLKKYATKAHEISTDVPARMHCHMLRHSKAMHLLQAGVNMVYIRDFLGHADLATTEIYAKADTELKRKALENAYPELVDSNLPDWNQNPDLMDWLNKL